MDSIPQQLFWIFFKPKCSGCLNLHCFAYVIRAHSTLLPLSLHCQYHLLTTPSPDVFLVIEQHSSSQIQPHCRIVFYACAYSSTGSTYERGYLCSASRRRIFCSNSGSGFVKMPDMSKSAASVASSLCPLSPDKYFTVDSSIARSNLAVESGKGFPFGATT
jgi:hypothetical protein